MSVYISLEAAIAAAMRADDNGVSLEGAKKMSRAVVAELESLPAADVVEVHAVINRMNEERKRAKGNWHTDPYWLGWVDAMGRAQRIVDGTIDDEPMYAPSTGEKKEDKQG